MGEHRLDRLFEHGPGMFGRFISAAGRQWHSMERSWRGNQPRVSCVRPGRYELVRWPSAKLRGSDHVFALVGGDVGLAPGPGITRTFVEIHPANFPLELQGCIALGLSLTWVPAARVPGSPRQPMLATSAVAVREFFAELEADSGPHFLTISGGVADGPESRSD